MVKSGPKILLVVHAYMEKRPKISISDCILEERRDNNGQLVEAMCFLLLRLLILCLLVIF